jgi:outer membrane lipoprotein-sorting protein
MRFRIQLVSALIFVCSSIVAQNTMFKPIAKTDIPTTISKIENASAVLTTLQCSFTQTKNIAVLEETIVSKGKLRFKKENMLSWEYLSPYYYLFALNGDKVYIKNDTKTSEFDTKSNALFKEISLLLMNSIGGTGLIDPKKFDAAFYENASLVQVRLTPKNKALKSFLTNINLCFDKKTYLVLTIEMIEPSGDTSTIVFSEVKLNQPISNEVFMVH